jgi:hypothetical protein
MNDLQQIFVSYSANSQSRPLQRKVKTALKHLIQKSKNNNANTGI